MTILRRLQYSIAQRATGPFLIAVQRWQQKLKHLLKNKHESHLFGPALQSTQKLKEIMTLYYYKGRYADGAVPVAWVTSGFPVEVLEHLGFYVVYPENHGALLSTKRLVPKFSAAAENEGYSCDLCGYARADIGCVLLQETPVGRLPRPDLLACCTNICQTVMYWYRNLSHYFNVPLIIIDTPYIYGEARDNHIKYVKEQMSELIEASEKISGKKVNPDLLRETMKNAKQGCRLWGECLAFGKEIPSPWTGFDGFIHMAPIVAMRGTAECNNYYMLLKDELKDRVIRGIGGVRNEKYRLLWDNLPIWYKLRELSSIFAEKGFNFVCTTYTNAWAEAGDLIDPSDPIDSSAKAYTHILLNRDLSNRLKVMKQLVREYSIHGVLLHSNRSCKPYSIGQVDLKNRLTEEMGVKALLLEADHADSRIYSDEQSENRLHAFMESFRGINL